MNSGFLDKERSVAGPGMNRWPVAPAALRGGWLARAALRKAGVVSALCGCGGLRVSALGVHLHPFRLMVLGTGVIGGIGQGLGCIGPVRTLIKWFTNRRGMATGMAIKASAAARWSACRWRRS